MINRSIPVAAIFGCIIILTSCNMGNKPKKTYTADEVTAESKKLNDFLDKKFDEQVARHPEFASSLGLKTGYDSWDDRSDEANDKKLAILKDVVDSIKANH